MIMVEELDQHIQIQNDFLRAMDLEHRLILRDFKQDGKLYSEIQYLKLQALNLQEQ